MKLPKIAIDNYQFVIILIFLGAFVGLSAYFSMPRSEDPSPNFPNYTVIAVYPGTSPKDMEELVVDPLEDALEEVDNIKKINTKIQDGLAVFRIEGYFGFDIDQQFDDIQSEINNVRGELPADLYSLDVDQFDPTKGVSIQQLALVSEIVPYNQLNDYAEALENSLKTISGLNDVKIEAEPEEQIRVSIDFQKMAQQHISLNQVIGMLKGNNANIPGGDVQAGIKSFNIKSSGGYNSLDEIKNSVVNAGDGKIVYLKDIAEVTYDYEDLKWKAGFMGQKAIFLSITQKKGENIVGLSEEINEVIARFKTKMPANIQLVSAFEQAPAVQARISDFFLSLLQGVLLVGAIILVFLGFRPSLIIMTVIPLSILMAIGALDFSGFGLQQISIAALVIALGLLVDNGIVVIENIVRFQKMGYGFRDAAIKGTSEVGYAIISSTVTTLLAFLPLVMMQSGPGEFLRSLPVTVILVLVFSLILALTLTPILAGKFLKSSKSEKRSRADRAMDGLINKVYRPTLNFALRKPWLVMLLATGIFFGSLTLFPAIGVSFFPTADKPMLLIEVETPNGTNIDGTQKAVEFVSSILDTTDFVKDYTTNAGHGNPMIYYNRIAENYKKSHGQILVNFDEWNPAVFYQTLASFRSDFAKYPGAKISFSELKNGPPFEAPIEIKIIGNELDTLARLAGVVEKIIQATPGTENVENPLAINKTDLKVAINRDKAGMIGLPIQDIDVTVRASLAGLTIDDVTLEDGEEYPLVVRMPFAQKANVGDFNKVYFTTQQGGQVPLKQVVNVQYESAVNEIQHYNTQRSTAITADVLNPDQTAAITEEIIAKLDELDMPQGYEFYIGGEYETQQESFGDLGKLLLIAMAGIFAVLVLQFRSIKQPLIVFSAIPLAITGSFVALYLSGWSFSFFAFVGFISLVGIVVNNSIILVDYTNQLMAKGMSLVKALKTSTETRFTPILLTTTTTILGLLPLTASGTGLWSPLGWTIIGGMISSTFLTLFIVPILYKLFTTVPKAA
ncbi:efflux RND transporter permease subunit [Flammeovirgaceae bacterium SG7u.111]|nr:efflux RND transporter permease subunit [Flammeovirgaceae bacterium SG7u.132]WPO36664.1 efflux RND transporter permease subunit [Flammeovirgaceae bacterium SG7u.111]